MICLYLKIPDIFMYHILICLYTVWWYGQNSFFLQNSQLITKRRLVCLVLYSFYASLMHSFFIIIIIQIPALLLLFYDPFTFFYPKSKDYMYYMYLLPLSGGIFLSHWQYSKSRKLLFLVFHKGRINCQCVYIYLFFLIFKAPIITQW